MSASVWHCEQQTARLEVGFLRATLDMARPAGGLRSINRDMIDAALLGLEIPGSNSGGAASLVEHYTRGADLVAAYCANAPTATGTPLRVDAVWRAIETAASDAFLAAFDLVVSVRTDLLQSRPAVVVQSALAASEIFRLTSVNPPGSRQVNLSSPAALLLGPSDGPGCVLVRLGNSELSYCEMIHPADFHEDEIAREPRGGGMIRLRHRLFPESLEKGVILRARVRRSLAAAAGRSANFRRLLCRIRRRRAAPGIILKPAAERTNAVKNAFITENFLLQNDRAVQLVSPIRPAMSDHRLSLPPAAATDRRRHAIPEPAQIWLYGDHYKWRAMRAAGVAERYCTGEATDREKFQKWAETVLMTLGNPLYHWTHMELNRPLGISDRLLAPDTARASGTSATPSWPATISPAGASCGK